MKFLFDLFPVILFFGIFKWSEGHADAAQALASQYLSGFVSGGVVTVAQAPVLLATAVAIVATVAQIGYLLLRRKKVDAMLWVSLLIICVFGGATIYFHNDTFIKWKPTVLYWAFAVVLLVSQLLLKEKPDPHHDGKTAGTARPDLAARRFRLDRLLYRHGLPEPVHRLQLPDRDLGQLQAVRRHGTDVRFRDRPKHPALQIHQGPR
ncbi:putative intracellular septation protein [Collimonas fungivorans Ter331]|uniref:Putative intracellular septation protein n=1 Tax=Collimonas fungivorans (strain Ter331) TaxID=1005048 RepID=G0AC31_COLFT|nr:putative intracellular septation protein [Collimonas fungivorans Ter331]